MADGRGLSWHERYNQYKSYVIKGLKIPLKSQLYNWVCIQRTKYRRGLLNDFKAMMLEELGIDWNPRRKFTAWDVSLANYMEGRKKWGAMSEKSINWMRHQRRKFKKGRLRKDREEILRGLGVLYNRGNVKDGA
jgi:hypothetical protein